MTIDLAALEDPTLAGYVQSIPLNVDPFPYTDLQAQGRYPIQSTPDTIPQMLAYLAGVDAESGQQGRLGRFNADHRLLVDTGASGGGGVQPVVMKDSFFATESTTGGSPNFDITSVYVGDILYGFQLALGMEEPVNTNTNNGYFRYYLKNSNGDQINLYLGQMYDIGFGTAGILPGWAKTVMYPIPRDVSAFVAVDNHEPDVWIETATHITFNAGGVFWSS